MARLRARPEHRTDAAIEELAALTAGNHGVSVERAGPDSVTLAVGGVSWPARVVTRNAVSVRDVRDLIDAEPRRSTIVVANQLSDAAKDFLTAHNRSRRAHGWSWLDRRGELQLNHPKTSGTLQFRGMSPAQRRATGDGWPLASPRSDGPIRGRAGISAAAALLLTPDDPPSIRSIARAAEMSHGAIGEAVQLLRSAGLVRPDGRPERPDLFWALAAVWRPTRVTPVVVLPTAAVARRLHAEADNDEASGPGWCVAGDEAAQAWGAPLFVGGSRPWIWVPTEAGARRAERELTTASWSDCRAVVAVPPTALVTSVRVRPAGGQRPLAFLPTAHPVCLALDLAQDPARGREVLEQWDLDQPGFTRVW